MPSKKAPSTPRAPNRRLRPLVRRLPRGRQRRNRPRRPLQRRNRSPRQARPLRSVLPRVPRRLAPQLPSHAGAKPRRNLPREPLKSPCRPPSHPRSLQKLEAGLQRPPPHCRNSRKARQRSHRGRSRTAAQVRVRRRNSCQSCRHPRRQPRHLTSAASRAPAKSKSPAL